MSGAIHRTTWMATLLCCYWYIWPGATLSASEGHGVSPASTRVFSVLGFPITDSIIASWIVSLFIIFALRMLVRGGVKTIPGRGQSVIEALIDGIGGIVRPILGEKAFKTVFPFLIGYFVFILVQNWSGLIPGIGSVGMHVDGEFRPFFRPGNSDLNTTLALALVAFFGWFYYSIKCAGPRILYNEVFGNKVKKGEIASAMYNLLIFVFFAVGIIESVSILCRIISLSFRLFGNILGGENLLHNMYGFSSGSGGGLKKILTYFIPLPFYLFEFLVAIIQAFVFTLLVSIYIGSVTSHADGDHNE